LPLDLANRDTIPAGARVRIAWPTAVLQQTDDLRGAWTSLPGATSPRTFSPTNAPQFFRVKIR